MASPTSFKEILCQIKFSILSDNLKKYTQLAYYKYIYISFPTNFGTMAICKTLWVPWRRIKPLNSFNYKKKSKTIKQIQNSFSPTNAHFIKHIKC